jgi:signal transduction histidine kinase
LDETVWAVNPLNDSLEQLATYLFNYVESFLADSSIRHRVLIPMDLPDARLSAELRHNLYLTFKEALNNMAKHARATEVRVELQYRMGALRCSIEDNGRGFDLAGMKSQGNGLLNMRRRIEGMGGQFSLESKPGKGANIQFSVPIPLESSKPAK